MYVRFVVGGDGEDHRRQTGVIAETRLLRDEGRLTDYENAWLDQIFAWFNDNVPVPPYSSKDWPRDVAAWFKAKAATPAISRIWDVIALLREHGKHVRILRSKNPGIVYYEDKMQIVVSEFRTFFP